jgi:hypothetical protein
MLTVLLLPVSAAVPADPLEPELEHPVAASASAAATAATVTPRRPLCLPLLLTTLLLLVLVRTWRPKPSGRAGGLDGYFVGLSAAAC